MAWTTPVDAVPGQIAGESSGMFSLNTYVRDNFGWLDSNKFEFPVTGVVPRLLDTVYTPTTGQAWQHTLCVKVLSGNAGMVEIEVGPTGGARTVIARIGTTAAVSKDEQYTIEFIVLPGYDYKFTSTGTIAIQAFSSVVAAWNL
jgi:hypothetical protein